MGTSLLIADPHEDDATPARPTDIALRALARAELPHVSDAYWRTYLTTPSEMSRDEAQDDILASWNGTYGRWLTDACLGAWQGKDLLGAILTVVDAPWADVPPGPFIIDLFVLPHARRRGIGRALVNAVRGRLKTSIALRVDDSAHAARALYESLGFRTAT